MYIFALVDLDKYADKTIMAMMDRFFNVKLVQEFATSIFELNIDEEIGTKVESPIISMNV